MSIKKKYIPLPSLNNSIIKYMEKKEIYWVSNASFLVGKKYKVILNEPISMELVKTLEAFANVVSEDSSGDEEAIQRFVYHCAVMLLLPLQVCLVPRFID